MLLRLSRVSPKRLGFGGIKGTQIAMIDAGPATIKIERLDRYSTFSLLYYVTLAFIVIYALNSTMNSAESTYRIKDMVASERPQERLERLGPQALSDRELLALLLRSGLRGVDVVTLAGSLLDKAGSLARLMHWTRSDFLQINGIGGVKAAQLVTVMELVRRVVHQWDAPSNQARLDSAASVAKHFRSIIAGLDVEKFWVLCLDRKNRLIERCETTSGTATSALVHPREVFRQAIRLSATAVVVVHNHPSGDPAPSLADVQVTRQLREAAKTIKIDLLDHVILGQQSTDPLGLGFYSFSEAGQL